MGVCDGVDPKTEWKDTVKKNEQKDKHSVCELQSGTGQENFQPLYRRQEEI